jgi:uncharacterized membrane protein
MTETHTDRTHEGADRGARRLAPVDTLRGLIMILMALDHASLFVAQQHSGEMWGGPLPSYTNAAAFLTRLVTHLCAPGFFFLMGIGVVLFANSRRRQGWSAWAVARHLLIRGGLLIALQLLVANRAWELSASWSVEIYVGVLFALGGALIVGSLLVRLKPAYLLALTGLLLLGTEILTPDPSQWGKPFGTLTHLLLIPGGDSNLWVNYPLLPWLAPSTLGMVFGAWLLADPRAAFRRALWSGLVSCAAFVVLRCLGGFGNIRPLEGDGWIDFLNLVKYPPSITFTLLTMGINLALLGLFGRAGAKSRRPLGPLTAFGRVPLFFYIAHLFLYAGLGLLLTPEGASLPAMYAVWLVGLLILYPPCRWYGRLRLRQPAGSLLRLF